jgi:hypothetical protein
VVKVRVLPLLGGVTMLLAWSRQPRRPRCGMPTPSWGRCQVGSPATARFTRTRVSTNRKRCFDPTFRVAADSVGLQFELDR